MEKKYEYYPFSQECDGCVIGDYTIANQWIFYSTLSGTYSFDGKKLILNNNESQIHLYHTRQMGYNNKSEYTYNKQNHTINIGIMTYVTKNEYCDFKYIDPSDNIDNYKVID